MKEIGGFLEFERFNGESYYSDLIAVNSGRNALLWLLKAREVKKIYIPYFLCDSVEFICKKYGYGYEYYNIKPDFKPDFKKSLAENEILYIVNYYGQLSNEYIEELKCQYENIIIDNVQAFFQKPVCDVDTIYTCRKFFGVPDGGYVSSNATFKGELERDLSSQRFEHLFGRFEEYASKYYSDYQSNEENFYDLPLRSMSLITSNLLSAIDYDYVCQKRIENFDVLSELLGSKNGLTLKKPVGPFCYSFYYENGAEVRKKLAEEKIYIPTLWPDVFEFDGCELEKDYAINILPLPCDQRYGKSDMKRLVEEVLKCLD